MLSLKFELSSQALTPYHIDQSPQSMRVVFHASQPCLCPLHGQSSQAAIEVVSCVRLWSLNVIHKQCYRAVLIGIANVMLKHSSKIWVALLGCDNVLSRYGPVMLLEVLR